MPEGPRKPTPTPAPFAPVQYPGFPLPVEPTARPGYSGSVSTPRTDDGKYQPCGIRSQPINVGSSVTTPQRVTIVGGGKAFLLQTSRADTQQFCNIYLDDLPDPIRVRSKQAIDQNTAENIDYGLCVFVREITFHKMVVEFENTAEVSGALTFFENAIDVRVG